MPQIRTHVIDPVMRGKVPHNWTSNNSESANHILKVAVEWKQRSMPDFISRLYDIVISEEEEILRAIRGTGNFKFHEDFQHHRFDIDRWEQCDEEKRQRLLERSWSDKGRLKPGISISTDGTQKILQTPSAGRKPNQNKRKKSRKIKNTFNEKKNI